MEEPQPHDSQSQIIKPSDYWQITDRHNSLSVK